MPVALLLALTVCLELALRAGLYNPILSNDSLMKRSLDRYQAMNLFGYENIHWLTMGDSRTDWGFDHKKIQEHQSQLGLNHIRLSFGRSTYVSFQTLSRWALHYLPNLQGILIGMPTSSFYQKSVQTNQYMNVWAFRDFYPQNLKRQEGTKNTYFWEHWYAQSYIHQYYPDLKDLIQNFSQRSKKLLIRQPVTTSNLFDSTFEVKRNLCEYSLETLQSCQETAKILLNKKNPSILEQSIINRCSHPNQPTQSNQNRINRTIKQWQQFFNYRLNQGLEIIVVLIPQHPIFDYLINPEGAESIQQEVIRTFKNHETFSVIDLRDSFTDNDIPHCQVYYDLAHYNLKGQEIITDALINALKNQTAD